MYHFIVNLTASSGEGRKLWKKAEKVLKKADAPYMAHFLKSGDEAETLVRKLTSHQGISGEDCHLVVVGGDGTLNAVLQGIESFERTTLSCLRTGSANDFAKDMDIPKDTKKALEHLLYSPREMLLDYGELKIQEYRTDEMYEQRRFLISSGIGYDADICVGISHGRMKKLLNRLHLGKMVYLLTGLGQLFSRKTTQAILIMEGEKPVKVNRLFFAVGMVHRFEGGGVPFCPNADPQDGALDLCLVEGMPKWKLLLAVLLVYLKKHDLFQKVTLYRSRRITILTRESQWFHMDGETSVPVRKLTMECRSGLRFLF